MEAFYEESAVCSKAVKQEKKYKIFHAISIVAAAITVVVGILFVFLIMSRIGSQKPSEGEALENYRLLTTFIVFLGLIIVVFSSIWLIFRILKFRMNVTYDYIFVSGELRIAKVMSSTRRKFIVKIGAEDVLALGDVETESFERICKDPMVKLVVCTSNAYPMKGKFFMYIHSAGQKGRNVYVLECREELLAQILRFVGRNKLAHDYVSQEKKRGV